MSDVKRNDELPPEQRGLPSQDGKTRTMRRGRITQIVVNRAFGLLYALILLQVGLEGLGARDWTGFKKALDTVTWPFLAPFSGLLPEPTWGDHRLASSWLAALVVYMLVHAGINALIRLIDGEDTAQV